MTVEELDQIRALAQTQLGVRVWFRRHDDCWVSGTTGDHETELHKTFDAMVARLRIWARPETVTITVPFEDAVKMTKSVNGDGFWGSFERACEAAIAPYIPAM